MDFFKAQELARKRTRVMVVLFLLAVLGISFALYGVILYALNAEFFNNEIAVRTDSVLWQPSVFLGTLAGVIILVTVCSLFKIRQLRSGGAYVAHLLGGHKVDRSTKDPDERMLLNVVEEMSIASGVPVPEVYLMPEDGINALAAGFNPSDAVVAVTSGCIRNLKRDELQGVVAHEFSHILNGDMRMNTRLMGVLFGILAIAILGQILLRSARPATLARGGHRQSKGNALVLIGFAVMAIGYIGVCFGRIIQSAISRQREYLADAAAVQFTRNPSGIAGALKKIGSISTQGRIANAHFREAAHFFFTSAFKSKRMSLFATHPPLGKRIQAIEPNWDGQFNSAERSQSVQQPAAKSKETFPPPPKVHDFINTIGQVSAAAILGAQEVHQQIGKDLDRVHQSMDSARGVILGLSITASSPDDDAVQLRKVREGVASAVYRETKGWLPRLRSMDIHQRFALLDAALPIAVGKDPMACSPFCALLHDLAHSDGQINFQELALLRTLSFFLEERRAAGRQRKASPMSPAEIEEPLCVMLSAIAYAAGQDEAEQTAAFREGARTCNRYRLEAAVLLPEEKVTLEALEAALDLFVRLPIPQKKIIFEGALAVVLADKKVSQDELSLIRIIAMSLGLPMPLLMRQR